MNFQQLRIVRETVRRNFNLTEVAAALFTSQPGVSKHIKDLEDELGVELFVRRGKRLLGLTEPGKELAPIVERILIEAQNVKKLGGQFAARDEGRLTVATTHTQARYALPPAVRDFRANFPKVQLVIHQASPAEIVSILLEGAADVGIATEALDGVSELATFPYYEWRHAVIVAKGHPLEKKRSLSLADIAEHPIVTYVEGFTGRSKVDGAFAQAGLSPVVAVAALDADVIKTYVEMGVGVGVIAEMAFDAERDAGLTALAGAHLFEANTSRIAVRKGVFLRDYVLRFIELCSPSLKRDAVKSKVEGAGEKEPA